MINELQSSLNIIIIQTQQHLPLLGFMLCVLWGVFILSSIYKPLLLLGIIPRRIIGLRGIIFAPLLHANFNHLFFNSIPLVVLSDFILVGGVPLFISITVLISLISGIIIWCFAKPGLYIGASALITGYWSFLVYNLFETATVTTVILGALSLYYFAGIFLGIFPGEKGVSWQGHLFGLVAGVLSNYLLPWTLPFFITLG